MNLPCIITALPAESRPFIEHFKMQAQDANGLRLYSSDHCLLLQTGIGKLSAAAKVAAMLHDRENITGIINVGIAGCDAPIGTQLIAGCVEDAGSGKRWYPHLPPLRSLPNIDSITVQTHDKPATTYLSGLAFDMEAAGVFSAARGKLDSSAVQSIKVVSDNSPHTLTQIDKLQVHNWMTSCISTVETMIGSFDDPTLSSKYLVDEYVAATIKQTHFTVTQKHQLHRLATQHLTLCDSLPTIRHTVSESDTTAKATLQHLTHELAMVPLRYPSTEK